MKFETYEDFLEEARNKNKDWYSRNKEAKKEYQRKRYYEKRDEILAKQREKYNKNKQDQLQELKR